MAEHDDELRAAVVGLHTEAGARTVQAAVSFFDRQRAAGQTFDPGRMIRTVEMTIRRMQDAAEAGDRPAVLRESAKLATGSLMLFACELAWAGSEAEDEPEGTKGGGVPEW